MDLLDVNVLIALADCSHADHRRAQSWFHSVPGRAWATCPITENAFLRIVGSSAYPAQVGDPEALRKVLARIRSFPGHQFWPDDLTVADPAVFPRLPGSRHLTDLYLLALAVSRGGRLATLDRRIDPTFVPGGAKAYSFIR